MSWKPECRKCLLAPFPGWELQAEHAEMEAGAGWLGPAHSGPDWVYSFLLRPKLGDLSQSVGLGLHHLFQGCTPTSMYLLLGGATNS